MCRHSQRIALESNSSASARTFRDTEQLWPRFKHGGVGRAKVLKYDGGGAEEVRRLEYAQVGAVLVLQVGSTKSALSNMGPVKWVLR